MNKKLTYNEMEGVHFISEQADEITNIVISYLLIGN